MKIKTNIHSKNVKVRCRANQAADNWQKAVAAIVLTTILFAIEVGTADIVKAAEALRLVPKVEQCSAEQGQLLIDTGRYDRAIREFTCLINAQPTEVEGYRGRIEAELLLGRYSDAVRDYARVTAIVEPTHPDAKDTILAGYAARLAATPENIPALTGASFARWWFFDYASAIHMLNRLLNVRPDDLYGNLFRGSSRLLLGATKAGGAADLERAIALDPQNPNVHFIVADAYTYGQSDPNRAFTEATLALAGGLDTPRIHAILASVYFAFGDALAAASQIKKHIDLVTTELLTTSPIAAGDTMALDLAPGRTYEIPVPAIAGETISIVTSSHDFTDTILVLLGPDGKPVFGNDDYKKFFAGFEWVAGATGTYRLRVTSFEGVSTGELTVMRN
jgi:tetratricopeptide (TPR) repeat protein